MGEIDGFQVAFVKPLRLRPSRLFWRLNALLEAGALERGLVMLGLPEPTVLHSHFYAGSAGAALVADRRNIPLVVTEHSSNLAAASPRDVISRQGLSLIRGLYSNVAAVIFVGEQQQEAARLLGLEGNFEVVPNPVDDRLFGAPATPARPVRLVSIGHLIERKRHDLLLRAFAILRTEHPQHDARLDIIGDGIRRPSLQELAKELGVDDAVTFHGQLPRPAVAAVLQGGAVYVHTAEHESFGVAIVEALMAGLPVVATPCGGVTIGLPDQVAMVVGDATPESIAQAVDAMLGSWDPVRASATSQWARSKYGIASVTATLEAIYRRTVSR